MAEEKARTTHFHDGQERELQESNEIQNISEEVMRLVQDDSREFSAEMIARVAPQNSSLNSDLDAKRSSAPRCDKEGPGAFFVSQGNVERVTAEHAHLVENSTEFAVQEEEEGELKQAGNENYAAGLLERQETEGDNSVGILSTTPSIAELDRSTLSVVATRVAPEEEEERVLARVLSQTVQADVVVPARPPEQNPTEIPKQTSKRNWVLIVSAAFLVIIALVVGLVVGLPQNNAGSTTGEQAWASPQAAPSFLPTLQAVQERGVLRCGLPNVFYLINYNENGERVGLEIDICKGFAAGIFGNKSKYEIVDVQLDERFIDLASDVTDLHFRAAPTIGRDVKEVTSGVGFSASTSYLHGGVAFGGKQFFVDCADAKKTRDECSPLMVCVAPDTTHFEIVEARLPSGHILQLPADQIIGAFQEGRCNVIGGDVWGLKYVLILQDTYGTGHDLGNQLIHESLAIVTRDDDAEWSDMVNWMLQSLFEAEKLGINQDSAADFNATSLFGGAYKNIFRDVVGAIGNYGELYDRHLESILPRSGMNLMNINHTSGLIWTPSFDGVSNSGPAPISGGELERISHIGHLLCGITDARPGFADFNSSTGVWSGLDVDFCRAVGSSLFLGQTSNETFFVEFDDVEDGYEALADRSVDVLCGQRVTLGADISGYGSGEGATFSLPYFYDQEGGNRALAARQSDAQWSSFVYWIVACTIYAEAEEVTQATQNKMPESRLFGHLYRRMFRDAILAVGNYGEMYSRNLESLIPRSGLNLLNVNDPVGPQFYPLPFEESVQ